MHDDLLAYELYHVREAARVLELSRNTLWRWLDGYVDGAGVAHPPVVRAEPTGNEVVTWGELVELAFLKEYRSAVSLQRLRPAVDRLRERSGLAYPLANRRPYAHLGDLAEVEEVQREAGLPDDLMLVTRLRDGQLRWAPRFDLFQAKVDFADSGDMPALRLHPRGRGSGVVVDPLVGFGAATVRGIRTAALAELVRADEPSDLVMEWYGLDERLLRDALEFEGVDPEQGPREHEAAVG